MKVVFHYETGYCGSEGIDFFEYPDGTPEDRLYADAHQAAIEHAESYGIYSSQDYAHSENEDEDGDEDEYEGNEYSDNIEGYWELYDPEKHDGLVPGGGLPQFTEV